MEGQEGVEKLFYEFSSDTRLAILRELQRENLKMQETARRLDLTGTEASRQLQRLSDAGLTKRQPDGSYMLTRYGKLGMHLSSSLEFVYRNREYFETHDAWRLPLSFIDRLGELSRATLRMDTMENIRRAEHMLGEAEEHVWGVGEGFFTGDMGTIAQEGIKNGVEYRVLSPLQAIKTGIMENRTLRNAPAVLIITEKEAFVGFRLLDGRVDYAGFFGNDQSFMSWVTDLFVLLWTHGKTQ